MLLPRLRIPLFLIWPTVILVLLLLVFIFRPKVCSSRSTLESRFQQSLIDVQHNQGDILEVATHRSSASFAASDNLELSMLGLPLPLGKTESSLILPVTFRFHLLLSDPWDLTSSPTAVNVTAPAIRPTLPPAPDVSGMLIQTSLGWARFNGRTVEAQVRAQVTAKLNADACTLASSQMIQDAARHSVELFLRKYFAWTPEACRTNAINVRFRNEAVQPTA